MSAMSSSSAVPLVENLIIDHEAEGSNPAWQQATGEDGGKEMY